jgi:hypothetical protein
VKDPVLERLPPPPLPYRPTFKELGVTTGEKVKSVLLEPLLVQQGSSNASKALRQEDRPLWYLPIEDESDLLQATICRSAYERYGDLLTIKERSCSKAGSRTPLRRGSPFLCRE